MDPDILLATLNAKFIHTAFGLRYLLANLGELRPRAALAEFDINQRPIDIAEAILARNPRVLGLGVYIWNVRPTTELVGLLKRARPELIIILGGPEVSFETEEQEIVQLADHVIPGEADCKFAEVCRVLLETSARGETSGGEEADGPNPPAPVPVLPKIIPADLPNLTELELPYLLYDDRDLSQRVIYVEASRGCPFTCEFCLSSLDVPVRQFPLERFLAEIQRLLDRGANQFKFVDRTFNLHLPTSTAILKFFLQRWRPGLFIHFEMVPDRLPEPLRELIAKFPPGALQFEVGIQTLNPEVEARISRRQNQAKLEENLHWLRAHSGVHVHADLIVGLPGESLESFGEGFDRLVALGPQEIQVGVLKRLRGTPIVRHDREWAMIYNPHPPYEIVQNRDLDFATLGRLRRFAGFWDLFGNRQGL
ncbi:MAG TPA: B12-binding domain-containing radical SAM protein [Verrucomicrobiales bacterium]|nr:B12-binding domain-containing radical SAM protein [Verrucomicrobiales bacterium]